MSFDWEDAIDAAKDVWHTLEDTGEFLEDLFTGDLFEKPRDLFNPPKISAEVFGKFVTLASQRIAETTEPGKKTTITMAWRAREAFAMLTPDERKQIRRGIAASGQIWAMKEKVGSAFDLQHDKPAKGEAMVRMKYKDVQQGHKSPVYSFLSISPKKLDKDNPAHVLAWKKASSALDAYYRKNSVDRVRAIQAQVILGVGFVGRDKEPAKNGYWCQGFRWMDYGITPYIQHFAAALKSAGVKDALGWYLEGGPKVAGFWTATKAFGSKSTFTQGAGKLLTSKGAQADRNLNLNLSTGLVLGILFLGTIAGGVYYASKPKKK